MDHDEVDLALDGDDAGNPLDRSGRIASGSDRFSAEKYSIAGGGAGGKDSSPTTQFAADRRAAVGGEHASTPLHRPPCASPRLSLSSLLPCPRTTSLFLSLSHPFLLLLLSFSR